MNSEENNEADKLTTTKGFAWFAFIGGVIGFIPNTISFMTSQSLLKLCGSIFCFL